MQTPQASQPQVIDIEQSITLLSAAALLSACSADGERSAFVSAFTEGRAAPTRRILAGTEAAGSGGPVPTPTELMDWAERAYPQYFPSAQPNVVESPYVYRHYSQSGNYVGVAGADVYVLGPVSGGALLRVGSLADFAPQVLATRYAFSDQAAARFLQHAQLSSTLVEIADVRTRGYELWLDEQMGLPLGETAWDWMAGQGYATVDAHAYYDAGAPTVDYFLAHQLVASPDAVRKRAALALSEYFVVSVLVMVPWTNMALAHYWDVLNSHAFGNFRDLLEAVTLNPAMGAWLNTRGNLKEDPRTGREPDENYAREVMQLFTIGLVRLNPDGSPIRDGAGQAVSTFAQTDVSQLARVFTGYDFWDDGRTFIAPASNNERPYPEYTRRPMVFDASKHSQMPVTFLGTTIPASTDGAVALKKALDTLFNHPNVGPFFGRQMIQRLVTSNPSPAYVARVAARFNDNGAGVRGDLKAVWMAILLDEEACGNASLTSVTHGKVREPILRVYQWARTFAATSLSGRWTWDIYSADPNTGFGQRLLWSPSVFNFFRPGYIPPGTSMAEAGATAPEFQIVNESSVSQWVNYIQNLAYNATIEQPFLDISTKYTDVLQLAPQVPALLARLNLILCAGQVSDVTLQRIGTILTLPGVPVLDDGSLTDWKRYRVIAAVILLMCCPEYLVQK